VKIGEKIPKAGLVLFEAKWFLDLGIGEKGSKMGDLGTLLENEIKKIESSLKKEINLINPGIIFDIESAGKALDLFKREKVDLIIVCNLTWSEDRAWIEILKNIEDIPIIYWEYMTGFYTTKRYTPLQLYHNSGIVGALQGSGSLKRFNKKFKLVMGEAREGKVVDEITSFAKASQVKNILKKSIIGLLPFRNDQMKVTCIDEYLILKKIGMILKILTLAELKEEGLKLSDGKVRTFMERNKKTFKVDKEMREKDFLQASRVSLAMSNLYVKYNLDALAINDVCDELHNTVGLRPCLYPEVYSEIGAVIGLEGDIGCTIAMYILYLFTKGPIGFTEVLNFNPEEGTINVGHPGPVNPLLAASNDEVTIVPDIEYINSNFEYPYSATLELIGKPGRVTMVNILDIGEDIQMIISSGKSLGDHKRLTAFPHFCIKTDTPVLEFISGVIKAGSSQHFAVVHGDVVKELMDLGNILNFKVIKI
jgi:L-fucose isomerase-like protein